MSGAEFYSRKRQFLREWAILWRMHGLDTFLGGMYSLFGFYLFHSVGGSQVYNVVLPFIIAGCVIGYLAFCVMKPQTKGNTVPFYFNFPRNRTISWDAQIAYLITAALSIEGIILIGTYFKLGGATYTPYYRIHPEAIALPYVALAFVLSYLHIRHSKTFFVTYALALALFIVGTYYWIMVGFPEQANEYNNFLPQRGFDIKNQFAYAALLFISAVVGLIVTRHRWQLREMGEIK
jgi:hypothetical protein